MAFKLFLLASFLSCVCSQAPGDGDSLCVDQLVDNGTALVPNPFLHPSYPVNVRPLMDSRDYLSLLDDPNPAWQQVDNDTSNSGGVPTHVGHEECCPIVVYTYKDLQNHVAVNWPANVLTRAGSVAVMITYLVSKTQTCSSFCVHAQTYGPIWIYIHVQSSKHIVYIQ